MKKTCTSCDTIITQIPYIAHESIVYRLERYIRALWVSLVISLICTIVMGFFLVYNAVNHTAIEEQINYEEQTER